MAGLVVVETLAEEAREDTAEQEVPEEARLEESSQSRPPYRQLATRAQCNVFFEHGLVLGLSRAATTAKKGKHCSDTDQKELS